MGGRKLALAAVLALAAGCDDGVEVVFYDIDVRSEASCVGEPAVDDYSLLIGAGIPEVVCSAGPCMESGTPLQCLEGVEAPPVKAGAELYVKAILYDRLMPGPGFDRIACARSPLTTLDDGVTISLSFTCAEGAMNTIGCPMNPPICNQD